MTKNVLSDITIFSKYAKFLPEKGRRENWTELCNRNSEMHKAKFPQLASKIDQIYRDFVHTKKVLPSMRSLQFGGRPIELNNARMFNCFSSLEKYLTIEGVKTFGETVGTKQIVLNKNGKWVEAEIKSFGFQNLQEVILRPGARSKTTLRKRVVVTPNHRWITTEGETTELKIGQLIPFNSGEALPFNLEGWIAGFGFGDGTTDSNGLARIRLCKDKNKYLNNFIRYGHCSVSHPPSCNGDTVVIFNKGFLSNWKKLPKDNLDSEYLASWVEGYLSADGYDSDTQPCLGTQDSEAAEFFKQVAPLAGLMITGHNLLSTMQTNYGTRSAPLHRISYREKGFFRVTQINDLEIEEEVFCAVVPDTNSFTLADGVLTGNCAYMPAESTKFFSELMFLLLGGTGVGYSVQKRHVSQLPKVKAPESDEEYKFQIQDSIIGWADAIKVACKAFFNAGKLPIFDYRDIRPKGTTLVTTGGKAPGPEPLKKCVNQIIPIFRNAIGRKLSSLEVHDIACIIADAVRAGGIRRAAMISLFDSFDDEMMTCKSGEWYNTHPYRARANNSVVLLRSETLYGEFNGLMKKVEASGCGEPGIFWTNDKDYGINPCAEIALRPYQMCNLTEINAGAITEQESFSQAASAAAFIGTLQASYTDFHYLNPKWKIACDKEALLGVSMTGIASGTLNTLSFEEAVEYARKENLEVSKIIGVNPAARITAVKPAGTTSLVLGTSSGIHAWYAKYYARRIRYGKDEPIAIHLGFVAPELVEQDVTSENQVVITFPQKAPEGAVLRDEDMLDFLERVKYVSNAWVQPGHIKGVNTHNVSCTVSVKDDEWEDLTWWMWNNKDHYNGISVLPYNGSIAYPQMPFEEITEEEYNRLSEVLARVDISHIREDNGDFVDLAGEVACAGGVCEL